MATDSPGQIKKTTNLTKEEPLQEIDKTKIVRNITRLLDKANSKQLMLIYQLAYEIVKKV